MISDDRHKPSERREFSPQLDGFRRSVIIKKSPQSRRKEGLKMMCLLCDFNCKASTIDVFPELVTPYNLNIQYS